MLKLIELIIKYKNIIFGAAIVALFILFIFLVASNNNYKKEVNRLKNNELALTKNIEYYKTKNGYNAAKVRQLELTASEFKQLCADQEDELEELGIKIKRLESMTSTGTETNIGITVPLKDTVFINKTDTVIKGKYFKWEDTWNKIEGEIIGDSINCSYHGTDTLTIVAHRVPKKFLFFKWGTKHIDVDIFNRNPNTKITYNKSIKIKKL